MKPENRGSCAANAIPPAASAPSVNMGDSGTLVSHSEIDGFTLE